MTLLEEIMHRLEIWNGDIFRKRISQLESELEDRQGEVRALGKNILHLEAELDTERSMRWEAQEALEE